MADKPIVCTTVGSLRKQLEAFPDDYEIIVSTEEMDADACDIEVTSIEGCTEDGPGSVHMQIVEV